MNFKSAMATAARLTAAGNLKAATATIKEALAGFRSGRSGFRPPVRPEEGDTIDVKARWVPDQAAADEPVADGAAVDEAAVDEAAADGAAAYGAAADEAAVGETGRSIAGSFGNAAGEREYLLYLPQGIGATAIGLPLVVMLHGCTQTAADFATGTGMNALADRHGFLVLYPAQSRAANQSVCWNWFNPADQRADGGEPSIIAGMTRDVAARYRVDPSRIYVAGLSAGGAMAAILANAYPELFAAVAVHSGLRAGAAHNLSSALLAMRRGAAASGKVNGSTRPIPGGQAVRTIVFHGRQDRTVNHANADQVADAALAAWPAGALTEERQEGRSPGGRSYVRTIHAAASGKPVVEQWEVQGAGHAWSGGNASGSHTDSRGPDASAAIVSFFLG